MKRNRYKKISETKPVIIYVNDFIEVEWSGSTRRIYEPLGYKFTKCGDLFLVNINDLPSHSNYKVEVICPSCKEKRIVIKSALTKAGHSYCTGCSRKYDRKEAEKTKKKNCAKCGKIKPIEEFRNKEGSPDGKCYWCKDCHKKYLKKYYKENKARVRKVQKEYYEKNREKTLKYLEKWRSENPDYMYHWYQDNKEKDRVKQHKRRARLNDLPDTWTEKEMEFALEYWRGECCYCREELNGNLHFDHYIPISSNNCPGSVIDNMLPSCEFCNLSKKNRNPIKWIKKNFPNHQQIIQDIEEYFSIVQTSYTQD